MLNTAHVKYLGAHMTSHELQHIGVDGVALVPKMYREVILVGGYPNVHVFIITCVILNESKKQAI